MLPLPTVVVPVFNAVASLDACLASLSRTLPANAVVMIADDASTDPNVEVLARNWCDRSTFAASYIRRPVNLGFPANCNAAFAEAGRADVVLLNSDAIATTGWLSQIARCAANDPRIATITPWSNNAEICSFPRFVEANPIPDDPDRIALAAASQAALDYPDLPTAVGFCMFVRRAALDQVGGFDVDTFGRGSGEGNDFSRRVAAMGWGNALCDGANVAHAGNASFGPLGQGPGGENLRRLQARWPDYNERVARFILADPLRPLRDRLAGHLAELDRGGPQRDLFG